MNAKPVVAAVIAFSMGYAAQINIPVSSSHAPLRISVPEVNADPAVRGQARRTSRRTSRRVNRRQSVAGCTPYNAYYNCGGVYYRPVVENGTTVYVVVNP
ncbi:hypothetical protein E1162_16200 [Rhodobacteraceae bacterium RKSG542]|uniref:hypothetical protein n=1 Tax=Pseudovibrio flavus TaxID=2529854 RepID=UPI0012BD136B|nr:hypothetical protein [Pseudovibrio flavus]MTI18789.1 hypothetical protein [Pseudovibrio flavus]